MHLAWTGGGGSSLSSVLKFIDPDAAQPQPVSLPGLETATVGMLEATGISPAWIYAYKHIGGGRAGYRPPQVPLPRLPEASEMIDAPQAGHIGLPSDALTAVVLSGSHPRFDQNLSRSNRLLSGGLLTRERICKGGWLPIGNPDYTYVQGSGRHRCPHRGWRDHAPAAR